MTTIRVNILMMLILTLPVAQAQEDLSASEKQYSDRVNQACDLKISFDLHDFEYGRDETQVYSNLHFEDTSLISGHLAEACKVNPENRNKIARVGTIFVKRGSINDRKLIQRKNGDLVYLSTRMDSENSKGRKELITEDLIRVLGLNFKKPEVKKVENEVKVRVPDKSKDKEKKIAELTAWFLGEVKKSQSLPPAETGPAMEKLSKQYEEKLNALINTP